MNLFKSLLVAPAALGLLAPFAANASEVNLNGVSNYSRELQMSSDTFDKQPSSESRLLAGGEGMVDSNSYDGSFSSTTTAAFSADFEIGFEDGGGGFAVDEATQAYYGFQIDLNTSFTGEDSLDISLDAGNANSSEFDLNSTTNEALTVDGVAYTFPIGPVTAFVGDNMDGSTLYNTACVYGGPSNTLDDCGNPNAALGSGSGTAAGASYEFGDGFAVAIGYTGNGSSTSGLATKEGDDQVGGQLSYTADQYGVSVTAAQIENYSGDASAITDRNFWALNGYWTPEDTGLIPSVSGGYEVGDAQGQSDTKAWFVGLQWDEMLKGTLGAAVGTQGASRQIKYEDPELLMYEAFYSYEVSDGMTVTPLVYFKDMNEAKSKTGVMVKTSFSF